MSIIRRVHVPLREPRDVIPHLGAAHHWKDGRSAKLLIDQWWAANDIPASVRAILGQAEAWKNAELLDAFAERCTSLEDGRASHSQSDMLALVGLDAELGVLSIEAKVDEGFDRTVARWLADNSVGKAARLAKLVALFGMAGTDVGPLRYQLLHRTASAVLEAQRYRASHAAMIVQSWSPERDGFDDFAAFAAAIGARGAAAGSLSDPIEVGGVSLRLGWSSENG
jgi:hypothetical protein